MAKTKQEQQKYIAEWTAANTDKFVVKANKRLQLAALVDKAVSAGRAASRQAYIVEAIQQRLAADGVTLDE